MLQTSGSDGMHRLAEYELASYPPRACQTIRNRADVMTAPDSLRGNKLKACSIWELLARSGLVSKGRLFARVSFLHDTLLAAQDLERGLRGRGQSLHALI